MNDIEIAEEFINILKELSLSINEIEYVKALENLIQRNKELEQIEKEHKEENGRLREELTQSQKREWLIRYKLERDIEIYSKEGCCRKQVREGIVREAKEILELLGDDK